VSPPPAIPKQLPNSDHENWFRDEIQSHDGSLKAYLRRAFPGIRDVDDTVQESYLRVWKAKMVRPIVSAKSFLFQIARHLAIDTVRRNHGGMIESYGDLAELPVVDQKPDAAATLSYNEKVDLLAGAIVALPARCREVVMLRRFKGLSQKETARVLGISERTVESQLARGMSLCKAFLRKRGHE
jgi:RNA polymerase sigma factor (sigma-70 family)